MREIKILIGRHYGLEATHVTSLVLDNILPILRTRFKVKIIWFFYLPERVKEVSISKSDTEIIDIHDFNNALEALEKVKPDLVLDNEFPSLMDLAIDNAAKHLNIPVLIKVNSDNELKITKRQLFTNFIPSFFHSLMPYEKNGKKKFMKRGRFFIYKYMFLLKTLKAINMNFFKIIHYFFIVLNWHFSYHIPFIDRRFVFTLHYLENETLLKKMLKVGIPKSNLIVTGNPMFDPLFKKFMHKESYPPTGRIRILFFPMQYYESGIWSKKQRDYAITEIVKIITKYKNKFSLQVKLHPTTQVYEDYSSLIHKIDPSVKIHQKGSIIDYLDETDVFISLVPISSAGIFPLIAHKPLVLCNFFNYQNESFLKSGLAVECKNPEDLIKLVETSLSTKNVSKEKIDDYIKEFLYKPDGRASERLCQGIINLLK